MKNVMMTFCLIVTVLFIWVWHNQTQFNDLSRKAMFHLNTGELDEAIEAYTKAIKHKERTIFFTKDPAAYNNLGQAYLRKAEYDEAIAAFKKVIEIKPDAVQAYVNLATVYLKQNSSKQAIEAAEHAIKIAPNSAIGHYNLACAYALADENTLAIESLKKSIGLDAQMKAFARDEKVFEKLRSRPDFPD